MNAVTPMDLTITPRDARFGRSGSLRRWWLADDPVATAFYNALSATFPKGEAFFIESVRLFRDGAEPKLDREINAFIRQEVVHSREHLVFNRHVVDQGYTITLLDEHVDRVLAMARRNPAIYRLAATTCLEHFTAILAHELIADPRHLAGGDPEAVALWRWHAAEEIEHKGVAYDTWLHATKDWPRFRRWATKAIVMLSTTYNFSVGRWKGMLELLRQDGVTGLGARTRLFRYAFARPGIARKVAGAWLSFFMPGFHPWKIDDRALIALAESDYRDAVLPAKAAA